MELMTIAILAVPCVSILALVVHLMKHVICRPQRDMRGEIVLLTGAGGGLGRLMALQLAKRGCPLALVDVATAANEETASQVRALAPHLQVQAYTTDLGSRKDVADLIIKVLRDFDHVDVLLSNAAVLQGGAVCDHRDEEVDAILLVNLRATILLVRGLLPQMRARRRGQIVAVSSMSAYVPSDALTLYSTSKAGLTHFMECLYREMRVEGLEKDIVTTTIHPFFMSTVDLIVSMTDISGWLRFLFPIVESSLAAEKAVESIARGEHSVFIPNYMKYAIPLLTMLPLCLRDFALERAAILTFKNIPSYEYRHAARDIHLLHEFLVKGWEPFCDPVHLIEAMHEECTSKGQKPPYDFSTFREAIEDYYTSKGKSVPAVVDRYTKTT